MYLYKSDLLNFYDSKNQKIMIHMDTFCNSNFYLYFFPIADLKNFRLCNVTQQIKKSGLNMAVWKAVGMSVGVGFG